MTLQGKRALVTGGSRGIGAAIAHRLAAEGADVAITYSASAGPAQEVVQAIEASGRKAVAIKADAADARAVAEAVKQAREALGALDILVNNAGVFDGAALNETTDEAFDRTMDINVKAVFVASREAAKLMGEGGRIVNIGSILGQRAQTPGIALYVMSKFAVAGLTRALAHDLAPMKITVNNVQPGPIDTDMNPKDAGAFADSMRDGTALKRYGVPEEVAAAVAFFASADAAYVTGATLNVDGGTEA
jgi:3-oxoacyl-[acyl-carrier protein] reductase